MGDRKIMLSWCQATGNLERDIARQIQNCHLPKFPVAWLTRSTGSSGGGGASTGVFGLETWVSASGFVFSATPLDFSVAVIFDEGATSV